MYVYRVFGDKFLKLKGIVVLKIVIVFIIFRLYVVEDCLEVDGILVEVDIVLLDYEM